MNLNIKIFLISFFSILVFQLSIFAENKHKNFIENCLYDALLVAKQDQTVAQIQELCLDNEKKKIINNENTINLIYEEESEVSKQLTIESIAQENKYLLVPHKLNYVLPITYNSSINQTVSDINTDQNDSVELKFQLSIKSRIAEGLFWGKGDLWAAYTNLSFWQAYDTENSSPFRETNHEPELFLDFQPGYEIGNLTNSLLRFGANHQSNGRSGDSSRSWNRIYALFLLDHKKWQLGFKPWYWIKDTGKDNSDIDQFLGYSEIFTTYKGEIHQLSLMFRNSLRSNSRFGLQLDYSYPISEKVRAYFQYYNGYGESLIDYNDYSNRIGFGIQLSDTLW